MKRFALLLGILLIGTTAFAAISDEEVAIYAAHKYNLNYSQQPQNIQDGIKAEYAQIATVVPKLMLSDIKNEPEYRVAENVITFEIWSKKYTDSLQIADSTIKTIYDDKKLKTSARYKLHNILVKSEASADTLIKTISQIKQPDKKLAKFEELAQKQSDDFMTRQKSGAIGWVEIQKLDKALQSAIQNKKPNDVVKAKVDNAGWQVIYIDDANPEHLASLEEATPAIVSYIKQVELSKKLKSMTE